MNRAAFLLVEVVIQSCILYKAHSECIFADKCSNALSIPQDASLVRPSSRLTRLQLIQIPPTNRQTALVLIHALAEIVDIARTRTTRLHLAVGRSSRGVLVLCGEIRVLRRRGSRLGRGAAAEPAADRVADGRTDRYSAGGC